MKIQLEIDNKDVGLIVQGLCCIGFNVNQGKWTPEQLDLKLRVEKLKFILEHDTVEKRFSYLSEKYPEHRQELNFYYWRHYHLYVNFVNGYFCKYTGLTI